ncbi:uncharacterized protein AMSG_02988 [Thecamonas trahens ATCC 50062]|uniref:Uncharacterized protein n=1 Tax=Thecamonas trahens ATCC 50062 TaxID=461836 RepID=A0A0L0D5F7_THETB|nr:hypothetical protein AMSG_02988 [Thecamonas trahens ATCC 50062]KNC46553.1 hypothetical protein AMSG_02988 [Thecamonas trahens ATCC 50062]|eukprot:XP_013760332.1 hypothetical protein AMSG_02988 [Thecamonas trahens ATCC 50062]
MAAAVTSGPNSAVKSLSQRTRRAESVAFRSLLLPRVDEGATAGEAGGGGGLPTLMGKPPPQTAAYRAYAAFIPAAVPQVEVSAEEKADRRRRRQQRKAAKAANLRWLPQAMVSNPESVPEASVVIRRALSPTGTSVAVTRVGARGPAGAARDRRRMARSAARRSRGLGALDARIVGGVHEVEALAGACPVAQAQSARMRRHVARVKHRRQLGLELVADDDYY